MIRYANENDIDQILELLVEVDMVHHNGRPDIFKGPTTKYTKNELKELVKDKLNPIFVYDNDGVIYGHAFCIHKQELNHNVLTDIKTLYIDDICVKEEYRGKNVGKSLFEYVKKYALENHYYNITLNVWSCNESAYKFYQKMGLVPQKVGMELILENKN